MTEKYGGRSPYRGLVPFFEEDAPYFFGRDAEREIIASNLLGSRLTLLYGASGVGKSSVLRAGVVDHLQRKAQQNVSELGYPELAITIFSGPWRDDPIIGLVREAVGSVQRALGAPFGENLSATGKLSETLKVCAENVGGDLLIILDQFEEYFLYHPLDEGDGTFAVEFPGAVNREDLRVNFLISMREDSLTRLDLFKGRIPNLFGNYLRIDHLDRNAAREAIEKPIERWNQEAANGEQPITVETALVEAVLEQVGTGRVIGSGMDQDVLNTLVTSSKDTRVQTPYLQLVMTRIWDAEMQLGSRVLRLETLRRLGGAAHIARTHLDDAMGLLPYSQQEIAARVFRYLVTPSGAKIAHEIRDLADYAEVPQVDLEPVLENLSGTGRILRPVEAPPNQPTARRYEIFHDVLAPAILDWRTRYFEATGASGRRWLIKSWIISTVVNLLTLSPIGAFIIVPMLRHAKPPVPWTKALLVGLGWIGGGLLSWLPFGTLIMLTDGGYIPKDDPTWLPAWIFVVVVFVIGGPLGGGIMFWGLMIRGKN